jgi:hypothetical protein
MPANHGNLQQHHKSHFPWIHYHLLDETVATDMIFSSIPDISGATCGQVFFRMVSDCINLYGLSSGKIGPEALDDFLREEGAPNIM